MLHATHSATGWGHRERERELRCIFYTHCTNNTAQVAAMRLLAGFEATSGTDSDGNGDADVNTDTDPATVSALTAYVLALHFSNSRPQRDVCQHKRRRQRRQRRPLAMAFERVNSICGDADVTPAARLRRSSTTRAPPPPLPLPSLAEARWQQTLTRRAKLMGASCTHGESRQRTEILNSKLQQQQPRGNVNVSTGPVRLTRRHTAQGAR